MLRICVLLLLFGTLAACTRVDVRPVTADDANAEGIRYYRPAPYLLIAPTLDKEGNVTPPVARVIWLPDKSQEYRMNIATGIGTAEMTPTLTDGWNLTAMGAKVDTKVPETLQAVAALIPTIPGMAQVTSKGGKGAKPGEQQHTDFPPGLYKIKFAPDGSIEGFGDRMWVPDPATTPTPVPDPNAPIK